MARFRIPGLRPTLTFFLLGLMATSMLAENATSTGIPGIDPLPAARKPLGDDEEEETPRKEKPDEKDIKTKEEKKVTTVVTDKKDTTRDLDVSLPLVRNIKVEPHHEQPYTVQISWNINKANKTPIYVARYVRPIESRDLILDAELASSPPLKPGDTSFLDYNLPDGAYYYAVVTSYEMSAPKRLKLTAKSNYTSTPSIIYRKEEKKEILQQKFAVQGIYAVNAKRGVKLGWEPIASPHIQYNIYKSYQVPDRPAVLQLSRKLATLKSDQLSYLDTDAVVDRVAYYIITVSDTRDDKEHIVLKVNQTFLQHTYQENNISIDRSRLIPGALSATLQSANSIKIMWVDPTEQIPELAIYRSRRPILSIDALRNATLVGRVPYGRNHFIDTNLSAGIYYYAVLPRRNADEVVAIFIEGRTFTGSPLQIKAATTTTENNNNTTETNPEKNDVGHLQRFWARRSGTNNIHLHWDFNGESRDSTLLLFRADHQMESLLEIEEEADFLTELNPDKEDYKDTKLKPGKYYYFLLHDYQGNVKESLQTGRNLLKSPIVLRKEVIPQKDPEEKILPDQKDPGPRYTMDELNRILARTFHIKRYNATLREIAIFVRARRVSDATRAKALLYNGLAYYKLGRNRAAMEYFLDRRTSRYYPERARFWYKRCIENTRQEIE